MRLWLSTVAERLRASLFLVPMMAVLAAIGTALVTLTLDSRLDTTGAELPLGLSSTVESGRALLGAIAGATITIASIAFSISLLVIQLASSQYSPRVVHTLFRDPFNKRVLAIVVGTFTYCLMVLRSLRSPLEDGGSAVVPNISIALAGGLGIATVLAVVALINHNAHAMDVSEILGRVTSGTVEQVKREWSLLEDAEGPPADVEAARDAAGATMATQVRFERSGWVQQIDTDRLLECGPDGATIVVNTYPGRFAVEGTVLCSISEPAGDADAEQVARDIRAAVAIGETRTMQQDVSYGLRQLADVAVRALSPGVNDPTTAQDAMFHATVVLAELFRRSPPPPILERRRGGWLVMPEVLTVPYLIHLTFDEVRRAAAPHPTVCIYVLEALRLLLESTEPTDANVDDAIADQARLVLAGCETAGLLAADLEMVREAYEARFGRDVRRRPRTGN